MVKKKINTKKTTENILVTRPPIVTVMGHVDHGKTTLLDAIRKTRIQQKETGGMTQSIGAYQVNVKTKEGVKPITFIDTPGHAAFTAMRSRGAKTTDIIVLVIAANDGVMPQTIEAIDHAKQAGVPIIVAVNKIDLPDINIDKIKDQLSKYDLLPEDWGGKTIFVPLSAKSGKNIEGLLEMILLLAEMEELKYDPKTPFSAVIIESYLDSKRGPVADIVVKSGLLKRGEEVWINDLSGKNFISGKIKGIIDDHGLQVSEAGVSMPVEILGLKSVVPVGEYLYKDKIEKVLEISQINPESAKKKVSLEDFFGDTTIKNVEEELKLILKSESQGTLEALVQSLQKLSQDKMKLSIIHAGTGPVTESDILLAKASHAYVFSFRLKQGAEMVSFANNEDVLFENYEVIYKLIEEVERLLKGEEKLKRIENIFGKAEVKAVFIGTKNRKIAGIKVTEGFLKKGKRIRIMRQEENVHESKIRLIKHLKNNVDELKKGMEGGITLESDFNFEVSDILESFS